MLRTHKYTVWTYFYVRSLEWTESDCVLRCKIWFYFPDEQHLVDQAINDLAVISYPVMRKELWDHQGANIAGC